MMSKIPKMFEICIEKLDLDDPNEENFSKSSGYEFHIKDKYMEVLANNNFIEVMMKLVNASYLFREDDGTERKMISIYFSNDDRFRNALITYFNSTSSLFPPEKYNDDGDDYFDLVLGMCCLVTCLKNKEESNAITFDYSQFEKPFRLYADPDMVQKITANLENH